MLVNKPITQPKLLKYSSPPRKTENILKSHIKCNKINEENKK